MAVQTGLCWSWSETPKTGFLLSRDRTVVGSDGPKIFIMNIKKKSFIYMNHAYNMTCSDIIRIIFVCYENKISV